MTSDFFFFKPIFVLSVKKMSSPGRLGRLRLTEKYNDHRLVAQPGPDTGGIQ